ADDGAEESGRREPPAIVAAIAPAILAIAAVSIVIGPASTMLEMRPANVTTPIPVPTRVRAAVDSAAIAIAVASILNVVPLLVRLDFDDRKRCSIGAGGHGGKWGEGH